MVSPSAALCTAAVLGSDRVYVDVGPGHDDAIRTIMQTAGAALPHSPDVVLVGFDGPGTYTLVEGQDL